MGFCCCFEWLTKRPDAVTSKPTRRSCSSESSDKLGLLEEAVIDRRFIQTYHAGMQEPQIQRRRTATFLVSAPRSEAGSFCEDDPLTPLRPTKSVGSRGSHVDRPVLARKRTGSLLTPINESSKRSPTGILVHGCHLKADGWKEIVWGNPPDELGRIPHAVLLAVEENASVVVFGTGASELDNLKESEYTVKYMWDHWENLTEFEPLQSINMAEAKALMKEITVLDTETQNTDEEAREGLREMKKKNCRHAILVSSPTHLPRCLAAACKVVEKDKDVFSGPIFASPSDTCYQGAAASDVVVVEPPHRGDRDKSLDDFRFHEMVQRTYRVSKDDKATFLTELDELLIEFKA